MAADGDKGAWPWPVDVVGGGRILIVDDDPAFRILAARALSACGHVVEAVATAEAALELLQTRRTPVDLLISDVALPGLDGPVWLREARLSTPEMPVIMVSGYAEGVVAGRFEPLEGSVFLEKPFPLERLTRAVRAELGRAAGARRLAQRLAQQGNGSSASGVAA